MRGVPLLLPASLLPERALQEAAAQTGEGKPGQRPGCNGIPAPSLQVPGGQPRHGDGYRKRTLIRKTRRKNQRKRLLNLKNLVKLSCCYNFFITM